MNDSIVSYYANAHKLITDSLGLPTIDQQLEDLNSEPPFRHYRVPVKTTRQGFVNVVASDKQSAESVAAVCGLLTGELDDVTESDEVGPATVL